MIIISIAIKDVQARQPAKKWVCEVYEAMWFDCLLLANPLFR